MESHTGLKWHVLIENRILITGWAILLICEQKLYPNYF